MNNNPMNSVELVQSESGCWNASQLPQHRSISDDSPTTNRRSTFRTENNTLYSEQNNNMVHTNNRVGQTHGDPKWRLKHSTHIKKPLNAFMLFMKDMRAQVIAECTLKESAAINQILGRKWHALSREAQAKYYNLAKQEKELHQKLYPGWSARDNYATQVRRRNRALKAASSASLLPNTRLSEAQSNCQGAVADKHHHVHPYVSSNYQAHLRHFECTSSDSSSIVSKKYFTRENLPIASDYDNSCWTDNYSNHSDQLSRLSMWMKLPGSEWLTSDSGTNHQICSQSIGVPPAKCLPYLTDQSEYPMGDEHKLLDTKNATSETQGIMLLIRRSNIVCVTFLVFSLSLKLELKMNLTESTTFSL